MGDKVKGSSPKKLKNLIEVPYVCQLKIHVFSFNMILLSSPYCVPRPSYPFRINFVGSGKEWFGEKAEIVNVGSQSSPCESTYPFPGNVGGSGKGSFTKKAKIVDKGSQCSALESTGCKLESEPCLFSVECS